MMKLEKREQEVIDWMHGGRRPARRAKFRRRPQSKTTATNNFKEEANTPTLRYHTSNTEQLRLDLAVKVKTSVESLYQPQSSGSSRGPPITSLLLSCPYLLVLHAPTVQLDCVTSALRRATPAVVSLI